MIDRVSLGFAVYGKSLKAEAMDGSFSCKLSDHVIFNFIHACANPVATHKRAQYKLVLELDDKILSLEGR